MTCHHVLTWHRVATWNRVRTCHHVVKCQRVTTCRLMTCHHVMAMSSCHGMSSCHDMASCREAASCQDEDRKRWATSRFRVKKQYYWGFTRVFVTQPRLRENNFKAFSSVRQKFIFQKNAPHCRNMGCFENLHKKHHVFQCFLHALIAL